MRRRDVRAGMTRATERAREGGGGWVLLLLSGLGFKEERKERKDGKEGRLERNEEVDHGKTWGDTWSTVSSSRRRRGRPI